MSEYFFGNKDITILQKLAKRGFQGKLDGILIVTSEKEIPLSTCFDYDSIKKIEGEHPEAVLLIKHLKAAFSQKDKNKNLIKPLMIHFVGIVVAEGEGGEATFITKLEKVIENKEKFIYGVSFVANTMGLITWAASYPKNILCYFNTKTEIEITETGKSNKVRVLLDKLDEGINSMELIKLLWSNIFDGVKFMELTGATPNDLKDGEIVELDKKGLGTYRIVNGEGEISNSLTTDAKTHIDTTYIMDSIKYLLAKNLHKMFKENVVNSSTVVSLVEIYSRKALDFAFNSLKIIESNIDGTPKYIISIPDIDGTIRDIRGLEGVVWKFIPNIPIESIKGTAMEVLNEIELTTNDLGGI